MTDLQMRLHTALADRYTIERELGRGAMATVYLARDRKHPRQVAIKVLSADLAVRTERFLREIAIAAQLTHPHILTLIDSGEADGLLYYVMPYIEGESLRDRLRREAQLPLPDALKIAQEVAGALDYAHARGVVHRDIKPENILLQGGHALVADFGIARALTVDGGPTVTETGVAVGTPSYMSPEQAAGSRALDGRSDVYSLACVVYEMLAGHPPFAGATAQEVLARHSLDPVPSLRAARAAVPEAVERAVTTAMAKQPVDRFAKAGEFADALTAGPDVATWSRARRRWAALASLLVLLTVAWLARQRLSSPGVARAHDADWARTMALPQSISLAEEGKWDSAWILVRAAAQIIPHDSSLNAVWPRIAGPATITTDPPDVKVSWNTYSGGARWDELGRTPLRQVWIPLGASRLRLEKEGYESAEVVWPVAGAPERALPVTFQTRLLKREELPVGMVYVPGRSGRSGSAILEHIAAIDLNEYFIDKYEITNREFREFVLAGGYRDRRYWQEPLEQDGRPLRWEAAIRMFVDRTGRPGPATWEGGDYPATQDDYPVSGVSWYEAAAYARFAGKSLPTVYHWARAAGMAISSWIIPASNFSGQGAARVGSHAGITFAGTYDMAGNVREWCLNESRGARYILGGGWNDALYMFTASFATSPWDRSPGNGFRLVRYRKDDDLTVASRAIPIPVRDFGVEQPAVDELLAVYLRMFAYDATPLQSTMEAADSSDPSWIRQTISFRAAYGDEREPAYVFLPRHVAPPYQTVVYFPGADALRRLSSDFLYMSDVDFMVKSGRAVIYPIYKSTYERSDELKPWVPDESNAYREHAIMWVKDLRRAIDYAETRADLDVRNLAYFGRSWGGQMAPLMIVPEPRVKVAIVAVGGLRPQRAQPEVDAFNYVSRVRIPLLMLSGRYDHIFPLHTSALPMFRLLGTAPEHKRHVISEGGHFVPRPQVIRETLDWLDRYLGPVQPLAAAR